MINEKKRADLRATRGVRRDFLKLKIVPVFVALLIASQPLALCASASTWEGNADVGYTYWGPTDGLPYQSSQTVKIPYAGLIDGVVGKTLNGNRVNLSGITFTTPVTIYVSGFYQVTNNGSNKVTEVGDPYDSSNYEIRFKYETDTIGYGEVDDVAIFTPNASDAWVTSTGIMLTAKAVGSEGRPIKDILLRPIKECGFVKTSSIGTAKGSWKFVSVRVIGGESSEELSVLDGVASEIAASNEILEAMKGDLVAILQDIAAMTGNIDTAASAMEDWLAKILPEVQEVAGNTESIYTLLGVAFDSLERTLESGFSDVIDAIDHNAGYIVDVMEEMTDYIISAIRTNREELELTLREIFDVDYGASHGSIGDNLEHGSTVQDGLNEMARPEIESVVPSLGDFTEEADVGSVSSFMGVLFGNTLVSSMLMVTLTMAFAAYVLYGKR